MSLGRFLSMHVVANIALCLRAPDELLGEKEKYKAIGEELDTTFAELAGF